ncbi:MAG: hypothetical protein LAN64_16085 [Acidobacteriia bacterium]|nr:hypothetical protein [Terriglobia bacterium]
MNPGSGKDFESIESAQDFVALLSQTVIEAKKEIDADVQKEIGSKSGRRLDALRLVSYSLEKLELHMKQSCRILNDLRSLRRLLAAERTAPARAVPPKPAPAVRLDTSLPAVHSPCRATVKPQPPTPGRVVAA